MNEQIGNSFILGFVITFIIIFMLLFTASLSYTKAFKVKNKIVEIVEKYDDVLGVSITNGNVLINTVETQINEELSAIGYRIGTTPNNCPERNGASAITKTTTANYEYCIYRYNTNKGDYFGVTTYMYYKVPLIGAEMKFPVYGETKISGILGRG